MIKDTHEFRDPIHIFIRCDAWEREVIDSAPFQRLRFIHQLALTSLVYPGATHTRFEHSLGVMDLASRVYDIVTNPANLTDEIRALFPDIRRDDARAYWKRILRMAALCHDIGHLPFSHAAEKELLPKGWTHEKLTAELIRSEEMQELWLSMTPPLRTEDIVKTALGPKEAPDLKFSDWETILSEIIVGDAFGVDRIDYLLRDSYHAGVAYGRFDHYRLIDTLRILPSPVSGDENDRSIEPSLGVEEGGIYTAEALLLARYFMFSQVYYHPIRRIYDIHLKDFLVEWLPGGKFSTDVEKHLLNTDIEVSAALREASKDKNKPGHIHAKRIINRNHFKVLWDKNQSDIDLNSEASDLIRTALEEQYSKENIRFDSVPLKNGNAGFPVLQRDGRVVSSLSKSETLRQLRPMVFDRIFIDPDPETKKTAEEWLHENKKDILTRKGEEEL